MRPMPGNLVTVYTEELAVDLYRNGFRVICLSEEHRDRIMSLIPDCIMGTIFLPPYESMDYLLDGRINEFNMIYSDYLLNSPEIETMVSIILAALYQGINIAIYLPEDEAKLGFLQVFSSCLSVMTGIFMNLNNMGQAIMDYDRNNDNMVRLYMGGFIPYSELLIYHDGPIHRVEVCINVCSAIGFITENEIEAMEYVNSYKSRIEDNNNNFLKKGFIKV